MTVVRAALLYDVNSEGTMGTIDGLATDIRAHVAEPLQHFLVQFGKPNGVEEKDPPASSQAAPEHGMQEGGVIWLIADVGTDNDIELLRVMQACVSPRARLVLIAVRCLRVLVIVTPVPPLVGALPVIHPCIIMHVCLQI
jgi:hypothetical protein